MFFINLFTLVFLVSTLISCNSNNNPTDLESVEDSILFGNCTKDFIEKNFNKIEEKYLDINSDNGMFGLNKESRQLRTIVQCNSGNTNVENSDNILNQKIDLYRTKDNMVYCLENKVIAFKAKLYDQDDHTLYTPFLKKYGEPKELCNYQNTFYDKSGSNYTVYKHDIIDGKMVFGLKQDIFNSDGSKHRLLGPIYNAYYISPTYYNLLLKDLKSSLVETQKKIK